MPRKSRIDRPGAIHHIIARGAVRELGIRQSQLARVLRSFQWAVGMAVAQSEQLAKDHNFSMDK